MNIPIGIITDGLEMFLDAANPSSYNGGSTFLDLSGKNKNGTLFNGVGYSDGSLVFDGVNDYVSIQNGGNIGSYPMPEHVDLYGFIGTIIFIAKGVGPVISNERTNGVNCGDAGIVINADGTVSFTADSSNNPPYVFTSKSNLSANISSFNFYANSVKVPSQANTLFNRICINGNFEDKDRRIDATSGYNYNTIDIGRWRNYNYGTSMFSGNISVVLKYSKILTDVEILQTYNFFKSRYGF